MGAKAEISWKGRTAEGLKREVYARRVGGEWRFFARAKRYDQWQPLEHPPLEDWLELLDAVQRRAARRLLRPEEPARVLWELLLIREVFSRRKPMLAICRGQQILNVALGGTLIIDIPRQVPRS